MIFAKISTGSRKEINPEVKTGEDKPLISTIELGLRTKKTKNNEFGWSIVEAIPYDEPCVLYLGGEGADSDQASNGYAKTIEEDILKPMGVSVPVYSVKYNFLQNSALTSRGIAFSKHRRNSLNNKADDIKMLGWAKADDFHPQYIDELYHQVLEPRITLVNGKGKLSVEEACRRMRMMTVVAHCHGGYVALELEKKLLAGMHKVGYTTDEQKQILSQMLTIAHSPACALGVAKSQMISFITAADIKWPKSADRTIANDFFNNYLFDRQREHKSHCQGVIDNDAKRAAKNREFKLAPCYFPPRHGNMFLIREKWQRTQEDMFQVNMVEHNGIGYDYVGKTPEGQLMTYVSSNLIKNGIKNSLEQKKHFVPLPDLKDMIYGGYKEADAKLSVLWNKMIDNGKAFRQEVYNYAVNKLKERRSRTQAGL